MQPLRHPSIDEMDRLMCQARVARSDVLFAFCARLWNWTVGRKAVPVSARFA